MKTATKNMSQILLIFLVMYVRSSKKNFTFDSYNKNGDVKLTFVY